MSSNVIPQMLRPYMIRPLETDDQAWVSRFIAERWGAEFVVVHETIYFPRDLPGFIAIENGNPIGLVTYQIEGDACEIVSLNSLKPNRGIGTALIEAVMRVAKESQCRRLWLVTTNDNLNALRFYQKRGFVLAALHSGAVNKARKLKPQIPLVGEDGIPIRDELDLEMGL